MSSTADRIGSRRAPRTPVPSRASTMTAAFSMPWPNIATSRATGEVDLRDPVVPGDAVPVAGGRRARRPAVRGDDRDDDLRTGEREPSGGDVAVAAVVARAAQDDDRTGPPARRGPTASALTAAATAVPACSIKRCSGYAERLGSPVGAGHRLGRDRRQSRARSPVVRGGRAGRARRCPGSSAGSGGSRRPSASRLPGDCVWVWVISAEA